MANLSKDKKYHFIYKTTNLLNGKYYIGMHSTNNLKDGYLGSGNHIRRAIKKYGKENFKSEILEFLENRSKLAQREEVIVTVDLIKDPQCMNLQTGGQGERESWNHTELTKKKISNTTKGKSYIERYGKKKANELIALRSKKSKEVWGKRSIKERREIGNKARAKTKGKPKQFKRVICPYCGKEGGENVMYKWHFDNCNNQ